MRALKILVVVMGAMLVVGFAALVAVIAGRVSRGGPPPRPFMGSPPRRSTFRAAPVSRR